MPSQETSTSAQPVSAQVIARRAKIAFEQAQKSLPGGKESDAIRATALSKIRAALEKTKEEIQRSNEEDMKASSIV